MPPRQSVRHQRLPHPARRRPKDAGHPQPHHHPPDLLLTYAARSGLLAQLLHDSSPWSLAPSSTAAIGSLLAAVLRSAWPMVPWRSTITRVVVRFSPVVGVGPGVGFGAADDDDPAPLDQLVHTGLSQLAVHLDVVPGGLGVDPLVVAVLDAVRDQDPEFRDGGPAGGVAQLGGLRSGCPGTSWSW
jgi:hypothetical protein